MEIYQWLLRQKGFAVSNTGYFVYANATKDREAFDGKLDFEVTLIPYEGNDAWVEGALVEAKACLDSATIPPVGSECDYCVYREAAGKALKKAAGIPLEPTPTPAAQPKHPIEPPSRKIAKHNDTDNRTASLF